MKKGMQQLLDLYVQFRNILAQVEKDGFHIKELQLREEENEVGSELNKDIQVRRLDNLNKLLRDNEMLQCLMEVVIEDVAMRISGEAPRDLLRAIEFNWNMRGTGQAQMDLEGK